ncbi:hypothetical protein BpHYR1_020010 [Brachionus plicatilis]|uniref:Uncharacterized protein n=1 Tax=Brachionus plicatilis TaxID=10195 RepID=A0A3M7QFZ8_BRAPC|nr:hypothetical protein BpHYR1_020010 [Brachionus plicatilis]
MNQRSVLIEPINLFFLSKHTIYNHITVRLKIVSKFKNILFFYKFNTQGSSFNHLSSRLARKSSLKNRLGYNYLLRFSSVA